jgi:hypothetical protein
MCRLRSTELPLTMVDIRDPGKPSRLSRYLFETAVGDDIHVGHCALDVVNQTFPDRTLAIIIERPAFGAWPLSVGPVFETRPCSWLSHRYRPVGRLAIIAVRIDQFETAPLSVGPERPASAILVGDFVDHHIIGILHQVVGV